MLGLTTTRRLRAELAAAKAETDRQRERAERALKEAVTAKRNRSQVLAQNRDLEEQLTATRIVNACLTEDLTEARAKLAASMDAESALARQIQELVHPDWSEGGVL